VGKVWVVETWFLLGVFAFLVCFVMVNRGESVVSCVANVVNYRTLFGAWNVGQLFWIFFEKMIRARVGLGMR
jgi:hypothetical protein